MTAVGGNGVRPWGCLQVVWDAAGPLLQVTDGFQSRLNHMPEGSSHLHPFSCLTHSRHFIFCKTLITAFGCSTSCLSRGRRLAPPPTPRLGFSSCRLSPGQPTRWVWASRPHLSKHLLRREPGPRAAEPQEPQARASGSTGWSPGQGRWSPWLHRLGLWNIIALNFTQDAEDLDRHFKNEASKWLVNSRHRMTFHLSSGKWKLTVHTDASTSPHDGEKGRLTILHVR